MGRTDRQMKEGGRKDDDGRVQIRRKAIDRFHLEDLRPHRHLYGHLPSSAGQYDPRRIGLHHGYRFS